MLTLPLSNSFVRKPVVILLLFSFLLQAGGLWLLLYAKQVALKREMKARLRSHPGEFEQTILEFELVNGEPKASSFEWKDDRKEFRYKGSMYDVIETEVTGDVLRIRCIDDKKESALLKKMEELGKSERGTKDSLIPMLQLLSLLLFDQHNHEETTGTQSPLHHIDYYRESLTPSVIDINSPPPKRLS